MLSFADYLARYPDEMAFSSEPPGTVFDRYHAPGFVVCSDGLPLDRERMIAHARPARRNARALAIDLHQVLTAGDQVAARYTLTARLRQERIVRTEIYTFGTVAPDGRLARLDQLTRTLPAGDA